MATDPRLPAYLRQSSAEIKSKFIHLEWQQRARLLHGREAPAAAAAAAAAADDHPSSSAPQFTRLTETAANTARNRYGNVEPFARNRIRLHVADGLNDYINASPIALQDRRYIATQGPKNASVNHFYRMLVAETASPVVVVMLTPTHEAGREKCFPYYPLSPDQSPLLIPPDADLPDGWQARVHLQSLAYDPTSRAEIRRLRLETLADRAPPPAPAPADHEIIHLLFAGWPDLLVPEGDDRAALLELVRVSAALSGAATGSPHPRVIHCSAGVGRSGAFIALDHLLHQLASGRLDGLDPARDPVAETVAALRVQRMMMVQGEAQFFFLYDGQCTRARFRPPRGPANPCPAVLREKVLERAQRLNAQ